MLAFNRLRTPAICFWQIFREDTGRMKYDVPVAKANPVRNIFNNLSTKSIPAVILGKVGAYVEATTVKIVYWMATTMSWGR
jgi:penicillin-binding protein-related factor A (putative recombinase)